MKYNNYTEDRVLNIRKNIIDYLEKNTSASRKDLFVPAIEAFNLTEEEKKNRIADSPFGVAMSISGIVINNMIADGYININNEVITLSKDKQPPKRRDLLAILADSFLTDEEKKNKEPDTKYGVLSSEFGQVYKECIQSDIYDSEIILDRAREKLAGHHFFTKIPEYQASSPFKEQILKTENKAASATIGDEKYLNELKKAVADIFGKGPEFFENFLFHLFTLIYGNQIIESKSDPGPNDDGVDCEFIFEDELGFRTKLIVQAKTKQQDRKKIGEKILREYVGVLLLEKADKCVICSNVDFTEGAKKKAKDLGVVQLLGIDDIFNLMKKNEYGLKKNNNGIFVIDEQIFKL